MGLPEFSTKKPVTTVMIFIGVMLFGFISLTKLPQELFPPITYPQLTVFTGYANAAPEEVETLLTKPIEEGVGTVSGLKMIRSISKEGVSLVIAEFDWDQNMDFASLRTREKVDLVKARLPRDSTEPLVVPFNPFEMPIMTISVTGNRSPVELRRIAKDTIKEELEKIDGVASASVEGGLEREILVAVDQGKMNAMGVSILDVSDAITNSNLNYPAGTIKESFYEYLIRTLGEFSTIDEIPEVVVKNNDEEPEQREMPYDKKLKERKSSSSPKMVAIKDIAEIKDTFKERSSYSRYNGKENVSVSIQKQAQANTMQVINRIRQSFDRLHKILPKDVKLQVIHDQSIFIKDAINGVRDAAFQGGILAFLVLLVFLRNVKSSAIVTLSIPISIMIVFTFMYFGGLSINMMSLGGLALGVGMLVDNAIVVMENIFRHREMGKPPEQAATEGAEEVSNAIVASTLTTIAVFLPMVFVVGVAGQLFKELAFTVTFSLIGSLWVALTLIPLLSCKLGGDSKEAAKGAAAFAGGEKWKQMLTRYEKMLRFFLDHKGIGLFCVFLIFLASFGLFGGLEKELMPKTDQGQFVIKVDMPVGTKLDDTDKVVRLIEDQAMKVPEEESVSSVIGSTSGDSAKDLITRLGSHQGEIIVNLKEKRKTTTGDVVVALKEKVSRLREAKAANIEFSMQQGMISGAFGSSGKPIMVEIKGEKMEVMESIAKEVEKRLEKIDGIFGIEDDIPEPSPEIRVNINKDKAALYNISVVDLARIAQMVLRGYISSQFKEKGREVDIRVRMSEKDRDSYAKLHRIKISAPGGTQVLLSKLAEFTRGKGPSEIKRLGQERTMTVSANVIGRKLSDVFGEVEKSLKAMQKPSGYVVKLTGESEEMKKSFNSLRFALILSIVLVYMIMAAQFESLSQPLIILFTVPLSLIGVLVALYVTNTSISVVALLGVIMLGGIVVNNGIVLIDYTNILMAQGKEMKEAVIEASLARLRPIIMTALTTVLGLFPMALAVGRGSELRAPMAVSVMGGLMVSTFLTLVVIPSIFVLEHEIRNRIRKVSVK
ncbi:MAG: efflux RND transporter permease subunit [Candidatus Omnitrophica bacterium]|nr:efflux RND transporter permease subunit [Candidatus Omnitrophota bacterium]MDD5488248.1 efflux RND transporter permease subunit [Candidatus Omnitrophota bacterium]